MAERRLNAEEREILDSYERGERHSVRTLQEQIQQYQAYAVATLETAGFITIAISPEDLQVIQRKAREAGVSSQRLIADILHQFVLANPD